MSTQSTTKQRKAYIAILTLALSGLGIDRVLLDGGATGPDQTLASTTSDLPLNTTANVTPVISAGTPTTRSKTLAGRLDQIAQDENFNLAQVDDAFRPAPGWINHENQPKPATAVVIVDPVQEFSKNHKLLALVNNAHGGAAIINNQTVVLGKVVDGFTLIEVTKRSAIFEKDGRRVEFSLPKPQGSLTTMGD